MTGPEYGIFFCANCGTTPYVEVSMNERPTADCPTCGFDEWIFEPLAVYTMRLGALPQTEGHRGRSRMTKDMWKEGLGASLLLIEATIILWMMLAIGGGHV